MTKKNKEKKIEISEQTLLYIYANVIRAWLLHREKNREKIETLPLYTKEVDRKIDEDLAFALSDIEKLFYTNIEPLTKEFDKALKWTKKQSKGFFKNDKN